MTSEYDQLLWLEQEMISWWDTMWYYNLLPSLQAITREFNADLAMTALQIGSNADATAMMETDRALSKHAIEDHGLSPGEQVCVAATEGGGFTRSTAFACAMRTAWERGSVATGLNTKQDTAGNPLPGATQRVYSDLQAL